MGEGDQGSDITVANEDEARRVMRWLAAVFGDVFDARIRDVISKTVMVGDTKPEDICGYVHRHAHSYRLAPADSLPSLADFNGDKFAKTARVAR
jgi:hypothetical protein